MTEPRCNPTSAAVSGLEWRHGGVTSHGAVDGRQWRSKRRRRRQTFDALRRQQSQSSAVYTVASPAPLFQLFLEVEAHEVLARDYANDAARHVDDGQMAQTERTKHDVCTM